MKNQLKQSLIIEIIKVSKDKLNYIYLIVLMGTLLASTIGIDLMGGTKSSTAGYKYLIFSLQSLSVTLLPIILLAFSCNTISSEITNGTIRNILVATHSKTNFLISKVIISLLFQLLLMFVTGISAILIGHFLCGFGDIAEDGVLLMSKYSFWITFFKSYFLLFLVLSISTFLGTAIALILPQNLNALAFSILLYFALETIKTPLHIENYVFSSYIDVPLNLLSEQIEGFQTNWQQKINPLMIVSTAWISLCLIISFLILKRREFR